MQRLRDASRKNTFMAVLVPVFTGVSALMAFLLFAVTILFINYAADQYLWVRVLLTSIFLIPAAGVALWALGTKLLDL